MLIFHLTMAENQQFISVVDLRFKLFPRIILRKDVAVELSVLFWGKHLYALMKF